jgi:hypothetical protein
LKKTDRLKDILESDRLSGGKKIKFKRKKKSSKKKSSKK